MDINNEEWTLDSGAVVQIARDDDGVALGIVAVGWNTTGLALITCEDMDELVSIWQGRGEA